MSDERAANYLLPGTTDLGPMPDPTERQPVDDEVTATVLGYGPVVIGNGQTLHPGDPGFEEAQANAVEFPIPTDRLSDFKPLGWTWGGKTFLFGEGEVSIERFNEVMGGDLGNGWSLSYEVSDDPE